MGDETLRDAYRALEQEAGHYADSGKALAIMRRRRLAIVSTAVAVLAITSGLWFTRATPSQVNSVATQPSGIGRSIHTACMYGCATYLTLTDGRQVLLGKQTAPPPGNLTLSPDGRWLGTPTPTAFQLKDLTGTTLYQSPSAGPGEVVSPWAWSADSRTLLLASHASGHVSAYYLLDLAAGQVTEPQVPKDFEPVGLARGELVLFGESQYGKRTTRVELTVGGRPIVLDTGDAELINEDGGPSLVVHEDRIYALVHATNTMIEFGLDGKELTRYRLSGQPLGPSRAGYVVSDAGKVSAGGHPLFELPPDSLIVVPGMARH
ncbi:hypothetical protein [Streptosporangium sp. NPDC087985]|uniref:hypothetical protein n=1 Tax=Streptosporangium sp. NPDC087985 TaxID=3366196 RepID=UPI003806209D